MRKISETEDMTWHSNKIGSKLWLKLKYGWYVKDTDTAETRQMFQFLSFLSSFAVSGVRSEVKQPITDTAPTSSGSWASYFISFILSRNVIYIESYLLYMREWKQQGRSVKWGWLYLISLEQWNIGEQY